jgi:hypothetical protein
MIVDHINTWKFFVYVDVEYLYSKFPLLHLQLLTHHYHFHVIFLDMGVDLGVVGSILFWDFFGLSAAFGPYMPEQCVVSMASEIPLLIYLEII